MSENIDPLDTFQPGIILVWATRPRIGHYGFLSPLRFSHLPPTQVYFFDEDSLNDKNEPIYEGAVVKYSVNSENERPQLGNIQLEKFDSYNSELEFTEDDFWGVLEREWFKIIEHPTTPVAVHLNKLLALDGRNYYGPDYDDTKRGGLPFDLADRLNEISAGPQLYNKYLFAKIKLRRHTQLLLDKKPQGFELKFLNRLLLEDAFRSATLIKDQFPDASPAIVEAEVEEQERGYGILKTPYKPARFYYSQLPSIALIPPVGSMVQCRIFVESKLPESIAYDVWELPSRGKIVSVVPDQQNAISESPGKPGPSFKLVAPLQFDWITLCLIGENKISSPCLPLKFAFVLKGWFVKNPLNSKSIPPLAYNVVADLYMRGKFMDRLPNISKEDIDIRLENQKVAEKPEKFAQEFARDFRRWLKGMGIDAKSLFACDRRTQNYHLVSSGWHLKKPVVNRSEVSLGYEVNPESHYRGAQDDENEDS